MSRLGMWFRSRLPSVDRPLSSVDAWLTHLRGYAAVRGAALFVMFVGAAVFATYPLVVSLESALPGNLGDPLLNAWTLGWGAQWLGGGRDVWNAPIFHPHDDTFAYSEHLLGISLFVAPVYWLTGNAVLLHNIALLGSFVLAGTGMYLLTASLTGRRDVAIVIALAFACSPMRLAQIARLQMLMTGWLPLALWAIHRCAASAKRRYLVSFGLSTLFLVLSNMYMLLVGALPIGVAILFELVRSRGRRWTLARDFGLAVGLVAVMLWPLVDKYRDVQDEMGFSRDQAEIVRYSATPRSYVSAFETMEWLPWVYPEKTADRALYVGGSVLLLAAAALAIASGRILRMLRNLGRRKQRGGGLTSGALGALLSSGSPVSSTSSISSTFLCYLLLAIAAIALSFGPVLRGWDGQPIGAGPYAWLQRILPGLDGLRVPGRFGLVAAVALGVMAGFGATALLGAAPTTRRRLGLVAAAALVGVEAWPARFPLEPFAASGRPDDQALYAWLRHQPASSLVELPASPHVARVPTGVLVYQYETLEHPHALVNGSSGFNSPLADLLEGAASPLSDPLRVADAVTMLRTIGVRYVAVHTEDYANPDLAARIVGALRSGPGLAAHRQFGPNHLFELEAHDRVTPHPVPRTPRIAFEPHQIVASHDHDRISNVVDRRLDSGWTTGTRRGEAWLEVRLHASHDVRQIRLELGQSREAYPRDLTIVSTGDNGQRQALDAGAVLPRLALGLVHEPIAAPIVIPLPPNRTRVLTLLVSDESPEPWSVHELALYGQETIDAGPAEVGSPESE